MTDIITRFLKNIWMVLMTMGFYTWKKILLVTIVKSKVFLSGHLWYRPIYLCFDVVQAKDAMGNYIKQVDVMLGNKPDRKAYGCLCPGSTTQPRDMRRAAAKAGDGPPDDTYSHMQEVGLFMLVSSRAVAKERILSLYYTRNQVEELRTPYLFRF